MKKNVLLVSLLSFGIYNAQVGINTNNPKATLEIAAKNGNNDKDGILIPRISKADLNAKNSNTYTSAENGSIVYVTDITEGTATTSASQTTKISQPGFYYFKDTEWLPLGNSNSTGLNPWLVQGGTTVATSNSENIYHSNKVSIGRDLSSSSVNYELDVLGTTWMQTPNDGLVGNNNTQSYQLMNRDEIYLTNLNRNSSNIVQTRAQIQLNTEPDIINSPNYNLANINISTGSRVTGSTRYTHYGLSSNDSKIQNGLGAHTFTTWLPNKTNSIVAIDENGLKLGFLNNISDSSISLSGEGGTIGINSDEFTATTYYLPKTSPTAGQVLMFDQLVPAANGAQAYTTTKWETLASTPSTTNTLSSTDNTMNSNVNGVTSSTKIINTHNVSRVGTTNELTSSINGVSSTFTVPNIYTSDGTISTDRIISLSSASNTIKFNRTATSGTTDVPVLSTNGSVQTIALRLDSDVRLKENIKPINGDLALKLNPVTYTWNKAGKEKGGNNLLQYGFIAQEVEKIMPDAVYTDKEGYKSVNYIEVIPVLTQKIKDQDILIQELIKRVENLENSKK